MDTISRLEHYLSTFKTHTHTHTHTHTGETFTSTNDTKLHNIGRVILVIERHQVCSYIDSLLGRSLL